MNKKYLGKLQPVARLLSVILSCALLFPGGVVWAAKPVPLSQVPVPMPPNLDDFVKNKAAAIKLGKALFWDMNTGGDGVQACASCHYRAGTDPIDIRANNNMNPGPNGLFDVVSGPSQTVTPADFPFVQVLDPDGARLEDGLVFTNNKDDVWGSQGVSFNLFNNIVFGSALDNGAPQNDPTFGGHRRTTGRNTPTAINAVFNFANFHDGRANNIFNGSSPIGPLDSTAGIWVNLAGPLDSPVLEFQKISIPNASLASQAVGPPNNAVEMSWDGRTWPELGRKLLNSGLTPLGQQLVSKNDSVLGALSSQNITTGATGLNTTYVALIEQAFHEKYWGSFANNIMLPTVAHPTGEAFNQMEANFSLFWGLSVMLYEATLVSDKSPFDIWLEYGQPSPATQLTTSATGNVVYFSQQAIDGFGRFQSKCGSCHAGTLLTDATVEFALENGLIAIGETNAGNALSDIGFANLGVRPTADDIGRGGVGGAPFIVNGFSISSFAGQAVAEANGALPFPAPQPLPDGVKPDAVLAVNGSFKTPPLRNLTLSAPYFHNGGMITLEQIVEFYSRNGNFANAELANEMNIGGLRGNPEHRADIVAFMMALTDPRVDAESAPFDHPELRIPDGLGDAPATDNGTDGKIIRPATGNDDFDPIANLLSKATETMTIDKLPKAEITNGPSGMNNHTDESITVGGNNVAQYMYSLDGGPYSAPSPATSPISLHGLNSGPHSIKVRGMDGAGHAQLAALATAVNWTVDADPPVMHMDAVVSMTTSKNLTITGTAEAGATVSANSGPGVNAGPCTVTGGGAFTCQVSGMNDGSNIITVTAVDPAGNTATQTATVTVVTTNGSFSGTATPTVADALKALRIAVGILPETPDDVLTSDLSGNGRIDVADALLILRRAVGL